MLSVCIPIYMDSRGKFEDTSGSVNVARYTQAKHAINSLITDGHWQNPA